MAQPRGLVSRCQSLRVALVDSAETTGITSTLSVSFFIPISNADKYHVFAACIHNLVKIKKPERCVCEIVVLSCFDVQLVLLLYVLRSYLVS